MRGVFVHYKNIALVGFVKTINKMPKFINKTVVVEAIKFDNNMYEIIEFSEGYNDFGLTESDCRIGQLLAKVGDWIVKDQNGKLSVCKSYIFERLYKPVD